MNESQIIKSLQEERAQLLAKFVEVNQEKQSGKGGFLGGLIRHYQIKLLLNELEYINDRISTIKVAANFL